MTSQNEPYPLKTAIFIGVVILFGILVILSFVRRQLAENAEPVPAAPTRSTTSAPPARTSAAVEIPAQSRANPSDLRQAREFLAALPPACASSSYSEASDGTVIIRTICRNATDAVDGLVSIKNGIVTQVR